MKITDPADAFAAFCEENSIEHYRNEPLCNHTSFQIGGPCDILSYPNAAQDVQNMIRRCLDLELPYFIMGNGSNLLVSDNGYAGAIICTKQLQQKERIDETKLHFGSGVSLMKACRLALQYHLSGLEFAFGIPGQIGGAAYMNAGAYGGEMKDVVSKCRHVNANGEVEEYTKEQLEFSYRHSIYCGRNDCITDVYFELKKGNPDEIREKMDEFYHRRKEKQPLDMPSAGSTFKRPENGYASALIDQCGLRGKRIGGAQVSEKHTGFIVNTGHATCRDVEELIAYIQETVQKQTGISLECEVKKLG